MFFRSLKQTDRLIIAIAATVFLISMVFIFNDQWLLNLYSQDTSSLNSIGQISDAQNDVRRRHGSALSWLPIHNSHSVYQGDRIFTGDNSRATIHTVNGEEIFIDQNSLVIVGVSKNSLLLSIDYGSVKGSVDKNKKILISSKEGITELSGDKAVVDVKVVQGKALKVNVIQGSVKLKSENQTKTLAKNEVHEIASPKSIEEVIVNQTEKKKEQAPVLTELTFFTETQTPAELPKPVIPPLAAPQFNKDAVHFVLNEKNYPNFAWQAVDGALEYEIEISKSPRFQEILAQHKTATTRWIWTQHGFGQFYARLRARGEQPTSSYSRPLKFKVSLTPPKSLAQSELSEDVPELNLLEMPPPPFHLKWTSHSRSAAYELQFSTDQKFSKPLSVLVQKNERQVQAPKPGTYYWRVRTLTSEQRPSSEFSETFKVTFSRVYKNPEKQGLLKALYPKAMQSIVVIGRENDRIQFRWTNPFNMANYRLQVAHDPSFEKILVDRLESKNWTLIKADLPEGWIYWRVRAEYKDHKTAWSMTSRFELVYQRERFDINSPLLSSTPATAPLRPLAGATREPAMTTNSLNPLAPPTELKGPDIFKIQPDLYKKEVPLLRWSSLPAGTLSVIEIALDEDFSKKILTRDLTQSSFDWISYYPGTFYWRVASKNVKGVVGEFSPPQTLKIILPPPEGLSPLEFSEHFPYPRAAPQEPAAFHLKWTERPFAQQYEVEFSKERDFQKVVRFLTKTTKERVKVSKTGEYYWRVRALNKEGVAISDYSEPLPIQVIRTFSSMTSPPPIGFPQTREELLEQLKSNTRVPAQQKPNDQ